MLRNTLIQYEVTHNETQLHVVQSSHKSTFTDTAKHINTVTQKYTVRDDSYIHVHNTAHGTHKHS